MTVIPQPRIPLARLQFALGLAIVSLFIVFSVAARFTVPYRDDWDWLNGLFAAPLSLRGLLAPHNEHVIPLARLLHWLQLRVEGGHGYLLFIAAVVAQLAIGALFVVEFSRRWQGGVRLFMIGLVNVVLFSTFQLQSIVFPAAILFPLVQLFALLAFTALLESEPARRKTAWVAASVAAALLAVLTTTNGFAVPLALALIAWRRQQRPWLAGFFAFFSVLCGIAYIVLVGAPWEHSPPPAGEQWSTPAFGALASYFLTFYGSALAYASIPAAIALGTVLFVLGAAASLRTWIDGPRATRLEWFATAAFVFAFASDAMATLGRAQFGPLQAAQSRYATYAFVYHAALAGWCVSYAQRRGWQPLPSALLARIAVVASIAAVPANALVGSVWKAKADNIATAGLAVEVGVRDEEWIATLHPITTVVYGVTPHLVEGRDPVAFDAAIGQPMAAPGDRCEAGSAELSAIPSGDGWRVRAQLPERSASGLVIDSSGMTVGRVEPAPLVGQPNPLEPEVVAAVVRALREGTGANGWFGFARRGSGAPYLLVPMLADKTPLCQISIRLSAAAGTP